MRKKRKEELIRKREKVIKGKRKGRKRQKGRETGREKLMGVLLLSGKTFYANFYYVFFPFSQYTYIQAYTLQIL